MSTSYGVTDILLIASSTSSKATCSWSFNSIANHVPRILLPSLKTTNYYAPTSDTLVIQSQSSRSQHDNEEECHEKLFQLLRDVSKRVIPGETSREQKSKVEQL
jgi:peptidyl-tRNA hydrolase ICT1